LGSVTIQLIRNATILVAINGKKILIDPMLSPQRGLPPIPFTRNRVRNPLVPLPVNISEFEHVDALLLTHCHTDHFDLTAKLTLNKNIPVLCQPGDDRLLKQCDFTKVVVIDTVHTWNGLKFTRVYARHTEKRWLSRLVGQVSGFIIEGRDVPSIYIMGDAVYVPELEHTLATYQPGITVANAGEARLFLGSLLTLKAEDIRRVAEIAPETRVVAVHMEALNHCQLTRAELRQFLINSRLEHRVDVPLDGEVLYLG
jgi:L-ascorbate metabolism protein UlaG (beta-lactamase superfamily)